MDRDPVALQLANRIFKFAIDRSKCNHYEFYTKKLDSLLDPLPKNWPGKFDAIIGNPPWKTRHSTDTQALRNLFPSYLCGDFDVYLAFILKAHQYLKPNGLLTMVIPNQFLFNQNAEKVRSLLLAEYEFLRLDIYPRRCFVELPSVAPISFLARKRETKKKVSFRTVVSFNHEFVGLFDRTNSRKSSIGLIWKKLPGNVFHPLASEKPSSSLTSITDCLSRNWVTFLAGQNWGKNI